MKIITTDNHDVTALKNFIPECSMYSDTETSEYIIRLPLPYKVVVRRAYSYYLPIIMSYLKQLETAASFMDIGLIRNAKESLICLGGKYDATTNP